MAEITKDEFLAFEGVRQSGVTNMFDLRMVEMLTDIPKDRLKAIMKQYSELKAKYLAD